MQVARAAEHAGFDRVLIPCSFSNGSYGLDAPYVDAYTSGMACLAATTRLEVLIAHRPGFVNPGVFAHMCATADEWSGGRLALNIVTAGVPGDMEQYGDVLDHDARYRRASEFVDIIRSLWTLRDTNHGGEFYRMADARLAAMPVQPNGPAIHLVGASPAAIAMAAAQADVYMMQAHTVEETGRRITEVRNLAAELGRSIRFAVWSRIITAETDEEARRRMRDFVAHADPQIAVAHAVHRRRSESIEDVRLRVNSSIDTWLAPNIWSGVAHLTHGAAWVGSYEAIAELMCRYTEVGVTDFQLTGHPYLEEAYHVGEHIIPVVKRKLAERSQGAATATEEKSRVRPDERWTT
ncbi:LLM class flavin-dependent oxidoreductase [Frankia sp. CNm7]|uniref:LLM class flavin-dependent oxidoreductase n=2 Tax=Frankia nepalensis TaxID=1836974 RepID=A0A937RJ95_9ACTN|nr:LLM class flavin-dependent oxidoreductase [Frankia nepalensis]MBL7511303.1 LLM class flavin-dependent oxidoreductase [Frankia nepalensis]MBL7517676.1 LLM class flavin-dependent oxidoreductase [Frankia nepalensis]MBL7629869.1 LLM class flavin-dependent oxidoreductase [Frankia nepalensis]